MATYTAITDAEIDQDSPITQTLMTKYRDNLTAVVEGDDTAPRILSPALGLTYKTGSGTITLDTTDLSNLADMGLALLTGYDDASITNSGTVYAEADYRIKTTGSYGSFIEIMSQILVGTEGTTRDIRASFSYLLPLSGVTGIQLSCTSGQILILGR